MKKSLSVILLLFILLCSRSSGQHYDGYSSMFKPYRTVLDISSNFHWRLSDGINTNFVDKVKISARMIINQNFQFVFENKVRYQDKTIKNKFADFFLKYSKRIKPDFEIPLFNYGARLDIQLGIIEWIPTYTNIQLILENAEQFVNPYHIYGATLKSTTPLNAGNDLNLHFDAHTGDLLYNDIDAEIVNLFLDFRKTFKYQIGADIQAGHAQGSQHALNFAYIFYAPEVENVSFTFKTGKLPSYDESPYGIHLGFMRRFKYIAVGAYYEKRIDQNTEGEIAGISWSIIGPPELAKLVSTFSFHYDFNMDTIWMWLPLFNMSMRH